MVKKFILISLIILAFPLISRAETFSDNSRVHVLVFNNNNNQQLESFNYLNSANFMYSNTPLRVYNLFQNYVPYPQYYYDIVYTIYFDTTTANNFIVPLTLISSCNIYIEGGSTSSGCTYTTNYSNNSITISASSVHSPSNQTSFTFQMNFNGAPSPYYNWYHAIRYELSIIANEDTSLSNDTFNQGIYNIINNQNANTQQTNQNINDIKDSITDSSIPSNNDISNKFGDFDDFLPSNNTISSLITMPLTLFQSVLNSINGTCQPFSLGSLLGTNLSLPCITLSNYLGSNLWSIIDILFSGLFIFTISKKFIKVFENFSTLREGDVIGD